MEKGPSLQAGPKVNRRRIEDDPQALVAIRRIEEFAVPEEKDTAGGETELPFS